MGEWLGDTHKQLIVIPVLYIRTVCVLLSRASSYDPTKVTTACNEMDLAIVCLGTGSVLESEGNDRADINLPGSQLQLLQDAVNAAKG